MTKDQALPKRRPEHDYDEKPLNAPETVQIAKLADLYHGPPQSLDQSVGLLPSLAIVLFHCSDADRLPNPIAPMWIVALALRRPYTFTVFAILILIAGVVAIIRSPKDIFPSINIPVVSVLWNYAGMSPEGMESHVTSLFERGLTTTVDNIEHIESQSLYGIAVIKVFLQPNASLASGVAQITSISQAALRQMPPGMTPPLVIAYTATNVPVLRIGLTGQGLSEQQLNDLALQFVRTQVITVPGAAVPYPYGGKQRYVSVDLNYQRLQALNLTPSDVVTAMGSQNLILPSGTMKIGQFEYQVDLNSSPQTIEELNALPIKSLPNGTTIYVRDVANVRNGFIPQTNVVRFEGSRAAMLDVQKNGAASTLDIVDGVKKKLPQIKQTLPPGADNLNLTLLTDQSIFVSASIQNVVREAVIAAALTALMILLFLSSWRSTLIICVSIPLSILCSIVVLSALGETINIMTLGGMALAVGILVDDATVEIENIHRNMAEGGDMHHCILQGAAQIAVPALVSTLCICIVFVPIFFLAGTAKYLFVPLAEAVVFAMLASYLLSRTSFQLSRSISSRPNWIVIGLMNRSLRRRSLAEFPKVLRITSASYGKGIVIF